MIPSVAASEQGKAQHRIPRPVTRTQGNVVFERIVRVSHRSSQVLRERDESPVEGVRPVFDDRDRA